MSNLVLFTLRSGSTFLADILSYAENTINVGEGVFSKVFDVNYNTEENKKLEFFRKFTTDIVEETFSVEKKGRKEYYQKHLDRIELLKNAKQPWTAKLLLSTQLIYNDELIKHCLANNIKIYLTHRKDIVQQFLSYMVAKTLSMREKNNRTGFIYTNITDRSLHNGPSMRVEGKLAEMYILNFLSQLALWRSVYKKYGNNLTVVSYEDAIKPKNFKSIGISDEAVEQYHNLTKHMVPTPSKIQTLLFVDSKTGEEIPDAWEKVVTILEDSKHLVEL